MQSSARCNNARLMKMHSQNRNVFFTYIIILKVAVENNFKLVTHFHFAVKLKDDKNNRKQTCRMVFSYLNYNVSSKLVDQTICGQPGAIEFVLSSLRVKIEMAVAQRRFKPSRGRSRSHGRSKNSI